MSAPWPPPLRLQVAKDLAKRPGPDSESFFDAYGLGKAYRTPGSGSSKQARVNAALHQAELQGKLNELLGSAWIHLYGETRLLNNKDVSPVTASQLPSPASEAEANLLQTIWDLLYENTVWPTFAELDRRFDRKFRLDVVEVVEFLTPGLMQPPELRAPSSELPIQLTIAGVSVCRNSEEDVALFLEAMKQVALIEADHEGSDPRITASVLQERVQLPGAGRKALLTRLGQLLYAENWGWRSASGVGIDEEWDFVIGRRVRRLRDVETLSDYWLATRPAEPSTHPLEVAVPPTPTTIFVVHGHDDYRHEIARFLERAVIDVNVIMLEEQANQGRTIIEKFEAHGGTASFAVVLFAPDDVGRSVASTEDKPRARQNIVFELGYFYGKLGRDRVVVINKGETEKPSNVDGVVYVSFPGDWKLPLSRELQAAGIDVDISKL